MDWLLGRSALCLRPIDHSDPFVKFLLTADNFRTVVIEFILELLLIFFLWENFNLAELGPTKRIQWLDEAVKVAV